MKDELAFVLEAQRFTVERLAPGASCPDLWRAYNDFMRRNGRPEEKRLHCHGQGYDMVEPPLVRFDEHGPGLQGPVAVVAKASVRTVTASAPLAVTLWVSDDMKYTSGTSAPLATPRPPVTVIWSKYRGPGSVMFDKARPAVDRSSESENEPSFKGTATTRMTFSQPGEYVVHVTANDYSGAGGGGFVCCWTTAMMKVTVQP